MVSRRPRDHPVAAVGLDKGDIDAVEGSAAHQADRSAHSRGALWLAERSCVR